MINCIDTKRISHKTKVMFYRDIHWQYRFNYKLGYIDLMITNIIE